MSHALTSTVLKCLHISLFLLTMYGCQKDPRASTALSDETYTINFAVQDGLLSLSGSNTISSGPLQQVADLESVVDYLYFWSFNNETLQPDVAIQPGAQITYNDGREPSSFAAGWPYGDYMAGRALSMTGAKEVIIEMPTGVVASLESFGFDISSSATGPKSFDLYYSYEGTDWQLVQRGNQFANFLTSQARNSFTFDLSALEIFSQEHIRFRLITTAGERGEGSTYNETSGALRLDNIRLRGVTKAPDRYEGDQLRIYAFDQITGNLVSSQIQEYTLGITSIAMELPHGEYRFSFLRHTGLSDLLLPAYVSSASTYYYGNRFSAYYGEIYGYEQSIFVNQDMRESVMLDRYYSQIKFQFTDSRDLSEVSRVVVVRKEEPAFYAPFNTQLANPILDQSEIDIRPNLALSKELQFNQFIGRVPNPVNLSYQLLVFGRSGELLRSIDVSVLARHNVQVVFRGELLGNLPFQTNFQVEINEEWDDLVEVEF